MRKSLVLALVVFFMYVGVAMASVNVNTATQAELTELPGIGDVKAEAIVDYRKAHGDFVSLDDLAKVKGIGDATIADLQGKAGVGETE